MNDKPILIIDTDPGHDDALAIMLLVKSGLFDIQAMTTVAGNSTLQNTTNNARYILDLLNSPIPLYSGSEKPLEKPLILANVHGKSGLDGANVVKKEKLNGLAVEKIIEIVRENPGKVSIVVLGPETNIGKAFLKDPELPTLIKQVVIMGGAIDVPGNKSRVAEFNFFVDPKAAQIVFNASVRKILIPLDVCNQIPLFLDDFKKIKGSLRKPIISMMRRFIKGIEKFEKTKGALVYDALAAYYLINSSVYEIEEVDIRVETKGEYTGGMSVADRRGWGEKDPNVGLVKKIDRKVFVRDFIKILSGGVREKELLT